MATRHIPLNVVLSLLLVTGCAGSRNEPATADPSATGALITAAETAQSEGRLDEAAASLERAIRIDSRNPELWTRLARVRLAAGDASQAESTALKATTLADAGTSTAREAWRIVADARTARGDDTGAAEARQRSMQ